MPNLNSTSEKDLPQGQSSQMDVPQRGKTETQPRPKAIQPCSDLADFAKHLSIGVVFLNDDLSIRDFNEQAAAAFGLTDAAHNTPFAPYLSRLREPKKAQAALHQVLESGKEQNLRLPATDGNWVIDRLFPYSLGGDTGIVLILSDIRELKSVQERLNLAMDLSRLIWWEWDILNDKFIVHTSDRCILGHGTPLARPSGLAWLDIVHPEDRDMVDSSLHAYLRGETSEWACEHRFRTAVGKWLWVMNKGRITERDSQGAPLRMVGTTRDIHRRKETQLSLDRSELFYRTVFTHTDTGIVTLNPDGKIIELNPVFARIIGCDPRQVTGKDYLDIVARRDQAIAKQQIAEALTSDTPCSIAEKRLIASNGDRIWVHTTTMAIRDAQGKVLYLLKQIWDITGMKQNEEQSQALREQLYQAQKLESIGTLAGGIAHDFNNILAAIMGFSELASRRLPDNEPALHDLGKVMTAAKRAKSLVNQILTFSRQQTGKLQPVDMYLYVREAVDFLRASIPTTVEIRQRLDKNSGLVMADGTQIHQIVVNLCTNAAHAIQNKGNQDGVIEINLKRAELQTKDIRDFPMLEVGHYLILTIKDNGCGMDENTRNRIFEPFFTTKAPGEGTGLGLPVVHGIINQYHGHIALDSSPGTGSTFTLYFPALEANGNEGVTTTAEQNEGHEEAEMTLKAERILLVDDEKPITLMAKRLLEDSGYRVTIFSNSLKAFQHYEQNPQTYNLIITDQVMPNMTGCELGDAIRRLHKDVPILIITGYGHNLTSERTAQIGNVTTLMKPFGADELITTVKKLISPDGD